MRARVVIGANFGDEGKGLVTDWLCATQGAGVVVRFNGGAQAAHTVVTPEGERHVFSHFGSGSFLGVPTFLSKFFVCNPIAFFDEARQLDAIGVTPDVYAHPDCLVTTFADMIINQRMEDARGEGRHGSVGFGVGETVVRSSMPNLQITMSDLWNRTSLRDRLTEICTKYAEFRTGAPIDKADQMIEAFLACCERFAESIGSAGIGQCQEPVFEGAQGLLLDQDNKEFFPHVTRSSTGLKNVLSICSGTEFGDLDIYYVSRTYMTRHGAGPLPGHDPAMSYHDDTNLDHAYQGRIRFGRLDGPALVKRCTADAAGRDFKLVMTHCDQLASSVKADVYSFGPKRTDVTDG